MNTRSSSATTATWPRSGSLAAEFPGGRCRYLANVPPLGAVGNWNRCLRIGPGRLGDSCSTRTTPSIPGISRRCCPACGAAWRRCAPSPCREPTMPALTAPAAAAAALALSAALLPQELDDAVPGRAPAGASSPAALAASTPPGGRSPITSSGTAWRAPRRSRSSARRPPSIAWRPGHGRSVTWVRMLRLTHLLRLRIAREQFAGAARARPLARPVFHLPQRPRLCRRGSPTARPALARALRLGRIPLGGFPAAGFGQALKLCSLMRITVAIPTYNRCRASAPDAGGHRAAGLSRRPVRGPGHRQQFPRPHPRGGRGVRHAPGPRRATSSSRSQGLDHARNRAIAEAAGRLDRVRRRRHPRRSRLARPDFGALRRERPAAGSARSAAR